MCLVMRCHSITGSLLGRERGQLHHGWPAGDRSAAWRAANAAAAAGAFAGAVLVGPGAIGGRHRGGPSRRRRGCDRWLRGILGRYGRWRRGRHGGGMHAARIGRFRCRRQFRFAVVHAARKDVGLRAIDLHATRIVRLDADRAGIGRAQPARATAVADQRRCADQTNQQAGEATREQHQAALSGSIGVAMRPYRPGRCRGSRRSEYSYLRTFGQLLRSADPGSRTNLPLAPVPRDAAVTRWSAHFLDGHRPPSQRGRSG